MFTMSQINAMKAKAEEQANAIKQLTDAGVPQDQAAKQVLTGQKPTTKPLIIAPKPPSSNNSVSGSSIISKLQENAKNISLEKEAKKPLNQLKEKQEALKVDDTGTMQTSSKKQETIAVVAIVIIAIIIAAGVLWGIRKAKKGGK
jgi:hypothetical protein